MNLLGSRPVQPASLALALVTATEALILLPFSPWHVERYAGWLYAAAGAWALGTAVLFCVAWARVSHRLLSVALGSATVLFLWVSFLGLSAGQPVSALLALGWVVLASGSAWLERAADDGQPRD